jgi:catechol 2,3-dioxygenase-like lactoylglutathione lyase family enzyme
MSGTQTPTHITGVHTIGVPVTDPDRAIEFYVGTLGFEVRMDAAYGEGERWVEVAPRGASTTLALVRAGTGTPAGIDTQIRLATSDAAADHAAMRANGVDTDAEIIPYPIPMFVFRDPDGNRLIVVEQPQG